MSFEAFMTTPVTIQHPGTATDEYGNDIHDWTNPDFTETTGWLTQLQQVILGGEEQTGQHTLSSSWRLFLRPTETITGYDRVIADGAVFQVHGHPLKAQTPSGIHHVEAELKLVE